MQVLLIAWAAALLFIGLMAMHQFSIPKNLVTILFSAVGIFIILFLLLLLFTLFQNVYAFILTIVNELMFRF